MSPVDVDRHSRDRELRDEQCRVGFWLFTPYDFAVGGDDGRLLLASLRTATDYPVPPAEPPVGAEMQLLAPAASCRLSGRHTQVFGTGGAGGFARRSRDSPDELGLLPLIDARVHVEDDALLLQLGLEDGPNHWVLVGVIY